MPRVKAVRDTYISHLGRTLKAGEVLDIKLPKVKVDGKLVDMRLSDNLELVKGGAAEPGSEDEKAVA